MRFLVFCCCTTWVVVMEDYSTDAFIQAFIKFSCRFGYPKCMLPGEGSQLVKGCQSMTYSFTDSKQRLSVEYGVQYMACPEELLMSMGKLRGKQRIKINARNERLPIIHLCCISNSINNLPIGLGNKVEANISKAWFIKPGLQIMSRISFECRHIYGNML